MHNQPLPSLIRDLRKKQGMSVSELARRLDVSQPHVSDIENGNRHPSQAVLLKLSKVLGVDIETLMAADDAVAFSEIRRMVKQCPALRDALVRIVKDARAGIPLEVLATRISNALRKNGNSERVGSRRAKQLTSTE